MNKTLNTFSLLLAISIGILPVIAVEMPRLYAFAPGIIGLIFCTAHKIHFGTFPLPSKRALLVFIAILLLPLLSALWSIHPDVSLERSIKLIGLSIPGLLILGLLKYMDLSEIKKHLWIIPAGIIAACLFTAFEIAMDEPVYRALRSLNAPYEQFGTSVFNRGLITSTLCAFSGWYFLSRYVKKSMAGALLLIALCIALFFGESQSAQLAIILGMGTYFLFPTRCRWSWVAAGITIAGLILSAPFITQWAFHNFAADVINLPFLGGSEGYGAQRLEIWDFVSREALSLPWFGHGIEATKTIEHFDTAMMYHRDDSILHPHNFALQLWMEFGVMGAAMCAALCCYVLKAIYDLGDSEARKIILATFIATLSIASMSYGIWQSWWVGMLIMLIGLTTLTKRLEANE